VRRAERFWTSARMERARVVAPLPRAASGPVPLSASAESSAVVPDPTAPGLRQNGAIFISEGPGKGFARCSGTSVTSPHQSLVFTAGHCVFDEGHWSAHHWVFVPAYRYGERPFGTFAAKWIGTTPGWRNHSNFNYDVGVAVVGRNERGESLEAAVGADKIAFDRPPRQAFEVYGYPVARPFNGSTLRVCSQASYLGHDVGAWYTPGPLELGVSCEISPGSSGGGWVIDGDTLDGVTSNSYTGDPTTDYGPYFGKAVKRLYTEASRVR
jgi:V8-like Glu-specific endopeptidase